MQTKKTFRGGEGKGGMDIFWNHTLIFEAKAFTGMGRVCINLKTRKYEILASQLLRLRSRCK